MAACLPTYRHLLRSLLRSLGISTSSSRGPDTLDTTDLELSRMRIQAPKRGRSSTEISLDGSDRTDSEERTLVSSKTCGRMRTGSNMFDRSLDTETTSSCDAAARGDGDKNAIFGTIRVDREIEIVSSNRE